ncbi:recombinase family protein (plasmid) [Skermanella rosea]|uniref:recombinase family protein n=1 Tax=Skermanella rosea TaxID=1817965 RepID=UPI001933BE8E|nr:recombinase family protein [Skermanella rosea]UEM08016.1 recombinase family protein [Skermanella rosea]
MQGFVSYLRVSTDRQGQSGLGLEAQRSAIAGFVAGRTLVAEFIEIESGKRNDRPQLAAALDLCRLQKTTLVIAKLDRLARNVYFIAGLMESGVDFVAVDMPYANRLTMHILAAVAEHEREMISARTKAALQAAKARGVKLGRPDHETRHMHAARSAKTSAFRATVLPEVQRLVGQGMSCRKIAAELNRRGVKTYAGKEWRVQQVSRLLDSDECQMKESGPDHVPATAI